MRTESALGTDPDPLEGLLTSLSRPLRHKLGGLVDLLLRGLLVFQLPQFGADTPNNHVLVLGQELERLEPAGALGVVFQIERVDVEVLKEPFGNDVVRALGEVAPADEVASAQVYARVQVRGQSGDRVVVQLDVSIKEVVDGADVVFVLFPAFAEGIGAEI